MFAVYPLDIINGKLRRWKLFRQACCCAIDRVAAAKERIAIIGRAHSYMWKDSVNDSQKRHLWENTRYPDASIACQSSSGGCSSSEDGPRYDVWSYSQMVLCGVQRAGIARGFASDLVKSKNEDYDVWNWSCLPSLLCLHFFGMFSPEPSN
jgi:hypothetical protein